MKQVSAKELQVLRIVAIVADFIQFWMIPSYFVLIGFFLNAVLDIFLFALFTWRLGFHIAFLPSFLVEFVPFVDVVPAWTMAILFVTRNAGSVGPNVTVVPPPAPAAATTPQNPPPIKDIKAVDSPNPG
jgi:hypothetical protein